MCENKKKNNTQHTIGKLVTTFVYAEKEEGRKLSLKARGNDMPDLKSVGDRSVCGTGLLALRRQTVVKS